MKALGILLAGLLAATAGTGLAEATAPAKREINISADSTPGWIPSVELEAEARAGFARYLQASARGDDASVWNLFSDEFKAGTSFAKYQADSRKTRGELGKLKGHTVLRLTWYKDPRGAPRPGIYAAIDYAASYKKTKRQCGYVILFKARESDPFQLVRTETNFMTDAAFAAIAKKQSKAEAEPVWTEASANCPNYKPPR